MSIRGNVIVKQSLVPLSRDASANGTSVDALGFYRVSVLVVHGAVTGAGSTTPSLEHSLDNTNWVAVTAGDLVGSFTVITSVANGVQQVDYFGGRRYVRVVGTVSGTHATTYAGAILLGKPRTAPAT